MDVVGGDYQLRQTKNGMEFYSTKKKKGQLLKHQLLLTGSSW